MRAFLPGSQWQRAHMRLMYTILKSCHCQDILFFFSVFQFSALWMHVCLWFTYQLPHPRARLDFWMQCFNYRESIHSWHVCRIYCSIFLTYLLLLIRTTTTTTKIAVWVKLKCGFQFRGNAKGFKNVWAVTTPHFQHASTNSENSTVIKQLTAP